MTFKFPVTIVAIRDFLNNSLARLSADTLGWLAAIVLHCATLPGFLALMTGLSDKTPSLDVILFLWGGLVPGASGHAGPGRGHPCRGGGHAGPAALAPRAFLFQEGGFDRGGCRDRGHGRGLG